ncbi:MAG: FGGY-family carbohydrate kinase [bacterium]
MYLAIDLGSTSFKAAVFTTDLQRVGSGEERVTHIYPGAGKVELPVDEAVIAFKVCIANAIASAKISPESITAIAITSQAQTFTIMDADTGKCRISFRSWQDERALPTCQQVQGFAPWNSFSEIAGVSSLLPSLQAAMLLHLTRIENFALSPSDMLMPLPSYFVYLLSGCHVTDNNIAAMSGLYSLSAGTWWKEAVENCGFNTEQLPQLHDIGTVAAITGEMASELGLLSGIPIVLAGNDQTAGAFGAEMSSGGVLATLGTALVAYKVQDYLPEFNSNRIAIRGPYPDGKYFLLATDNNGGNVINWAVAILGYGDDYQKFFTNALSAPHGSNGLVFTPDLTSGIGSWRNLSFYHTRADIARSVMESIVARIGNLIMQLQPDKSQPVFLAGGGIKAAGWVDMLAQEIGIAVIPIQADPLLGAARMTKRREMREE